MIRKSLPFCIVSLLLGLVLAYPGYAQEPPSEPTPYTVYAHRDYLILFIPGNGTVSLADFGFKAIADNGRVLDKFLQEYPAFKALVIDDVQVPICFRLQRSGNSQPLPGECPGGDRTVTQNLPDTETDIFWWDADSQTTRTLRFVQGRVLLEDLCSAGDTECHGTIPPENQECVVTSSNNINLRTGPGTSFPVGATLSAGQISEADGQMAGTDGYAWWHLVTGLWVREDVVSTTEFCMELPTFLFFDDFEQGTAKWRPWPVADWQIAQDEEGNHFYCVTKAAIRENTYAAAVSLDERDYAIQLDMLVEELVDGSAGIQFRYSDDPLATYDIEIDAASLDLGRVWRESGNVTFQPLGSTESHRYESGVWHTVQILAVGNDIEVLVDGESLMVVSDEPEDAAIYHGTIRIYGAVKTESPDGLIRACFDNVWVTSIKPAAG